MKELCCICNICSFMPEQDEPRVLRYGWGFRTEGELDRDTTLVIDDCADKRDVMIALEAARDLVMGTDFTYTTTIRCDFVSGELGSSQEEEALNRCAVWTHQLLENRKAIVSTLKGLKQMQVTAEDRKEGDIWVNRRLGAILCIPPLLSMTASEFGVYQNKVQRLMKWIDKDE